jgi:hypothetical protein
VLAVHIGVNITPRKNRSFGFAVTFIFWPREHGGGLSLVDQPIPYCIDAYRKVQVFVETRISVFEVGCTWLEVEQAISECQVEQELSGPP